MERKAIRFSGLTTAAGVVYRTGEVATFQGPLADKLVAGGLADLVEIKPNGQKARRRKKAAPESEC